MSPDAKKFQDDKARIRAKMSTAALLAFAKMPDHIQDNIIMHFLDNPPPSIIVIDDLLNAWLSWQGIIGYTGDLTSIFKAILSVILPITKENRE